MRSARALIGALGCWAVLAGCRSTTPNDPEDAVAADLRMLCDRIEQRNVSAWSQPAYMTDEVLALTIRIDAGERAARCELGQLMQRLHPSGCRATAEHLRGSC